MSAIFIRGKLGKMRYSAKLNEQSVQRLVVTVPGQGSWWEDIVYNSKDDKVLVNKLKDNTIIPRIIKDIHKMEKQYRCQK